MKITTERARNYSISTKEAGGGIGKKKKNNFQIKYLVNNLGHSSRTIFLLLSYLSKPVLLDLLPVYAALLLLSRNTRGPREIIAFTGLFSKSPLEFQNKNSLHCGPRGSRKPRIRRRHTDRHNRQAAPQSFRTSLTTAKFGLKS